MPHTVKPEDMEYLVNSWAVLLNTWGAGLLDGDALGHAMFDVIRERIPEAVVQRGEPQSA